MSTSVSAEVWYKNHSPWGDKEPTTTLVSNQNYDARTDGHPSIFLDLRSKVELKGKRVLAGDVLECTGDEIICHDINLIDLGINLENNLKKILSSGRVKNIISAKVHGNHISLGGSATVQISKKSYPVHGEAIRAAIKKRLTEISRCEEACRYDFVVSPIYRKYFSDTNNWEIKLWNTSEIVTALKNEDSLSTKKIKWSFLNQHLTPGYTFVRPVKKVRALVFKRSLVKSSLLSEGDLEEDWVQFSKLPSDYEESTAKNIGHTLRVTVKKGQIFSQKLLEIPFLIKRGDIVDVLKVANGMSIKMRGRALNNGRNGEIVSVRLNGKKLKKITGKASRKGVVELL